MKAIIGNDIKLRWGIFKSDGSPEDLSTSNTLEVYIRYNLLNKLYKQDYTIEENYINIQFTADEQKHLGIYDLILSFTVLDEGIETGYSTYTVVKNCAFELVGNSEQVEEDIEIQFDSIVSGLSYSMLTEREKEEITENLISSGMFDDLVLDEKDPTVPDFVKEISEQDIENWNNKSDFSGNYNDLLDKPDIPTKLSELTNDSGFITQNDIPEETDPLFTAWNKDYNELTNKPYIPTKTSDLDNDSDFIIEEIDPSVPEWAKQPEKPVYSYNEITNKPDLFSGNYNDLSNKPLIPDAYDDADIRNQIDGINTILLGVDESLTILETNSI